MSYGHVDGDAAAILRERRWFGAIVAANAMRAECEVLREVLEVADQAWRQARAKLEKLERLRDALGEEVAELDSQVAETSVDRRDRAVMSAA